MAVAGPAMGHTLQRALMYGIKIAHNQAEPRPPIGSAMLTV
jgi:hypothetical protein